MAEGNVDFSGAGFSGNADFKNAHFAVEVIVLYPSGHIPPSVGYARGDANFSDVNFSGNADFGSANFSIDARFYLTEFNKVSFTRTSFTNVSLNETDFNKMKVEWSSLKDALVFNGPAYIKLIKNFRVMEQFDDADDAYYQYRRDRYRKFVMIEGLVGWLTLALFLVTLANVMIRP